MPYEDYHTMKVHVDKKVAFVTIDNPPINLMTGRMMWELLNLSEEIAADDNVRVVVFDSADPDYFIAHFDLNALIRYPDLPPSKGTELHRLNKTCENFRRMPKVSIAKLEGRTRGGGSEFVLGLDMRFGAIGRAILNQPEVALGILPGGGGTQRLSRLIGPARALEALLGCHDFPAELAERYGWINRALPPEQLTPFVENLAFNIAAYPPEAVSRCKTSALNAAEMPLFDGLIEESYLFDQLATLPEPKVRMKKVLDAGGQTREGEMDFDRLMKKAQLA
ncbi:MAG: enoyl-CoA hydratase/isomerase family protein [Deltaproteobacteria bacterium]|nr:enoyl-CoA hydratase/isomerase family protein [Deltaproteobacteria bacterium]